MAGIRTRGFAVAVSAALLVAGAGCGGGSSAVTAPNTPKQIAADKALAQRAVLKLSDLPSGYTGSPHKNSGADLPPAVEKKFLACTHLPKSFINNKGDKQPNADAPDYKSGDIAKGAATEIDSSVEIDRSSKDISEPLGHLADKSSAECFQPFFQAIMAQVAKDNPGLSIRGLTVKAIPADAIGDQAAAFEGRVTLSGPGISINLDFDMYFVRTGRAGVVFTGIGFGKAFDRQLAQSLLQTVVDRLKPAT